MGIIRGSTVTSLPNQATIVGTKGTIEVSKNKLLKIKTNEIHKK